MIWKIFIGAIAFAWSVLAASAFVISSRESRREEEEARRILGGNPHL